MGDFFTKDGSEEGDDSHAGYVDACEGEDGFVFLHGIVEGGGWFR